MTRPVHALAHTPDEGAVPLASQEPRLNLGLDALLRVKVVSAVDPALQGAPPDGGVYDERAQLLRGEGHRVEARHEAAEAQYVVVLRDAGPGGGVGHFGDASADLRLHGVGHGGKLPQQGAGAGFIVCVDPD